MCRPSKFFCVCMCEAVVDRPSILSSFLSSPLPPPKKKLGKYSRPLVLATFWTWQFLIVAVSKEPTPIQATTLCFSCWTSCLNRPSTVPLGGGGGENRISIPPPPPPPPLPPLPRWQAINLPLNHTHKPRQTFLPPSPLLVVVVVVVVV